MTTKQDKTIRCAKCRCKLTGNDLLMAHEHDSQNRSYELSISEVGVESITHE